MAPESRMMSNFSVPWVTRSCRLGTSCSIRRAGASSPSGAPGPHRPGSPGWRSWEADTAMPHLLAAGPWCKSSLLSPPWRRSPSGKLTAGPSQQRTGSLTLQLCDNSLLILGCLPGGTAYTCGVSHRPTGGRKMMGQGKIS